MTLSRPWSLYNLLKICLYFERISTHISVFYVSPRKRFVALGLWSGWVFRYSDWCTIYKFVKWSNILIYTMESNFTLIYKKKHPPSSYPNRKNTYTLFLDNLYSVTYPLWQNDIKINHLITYHVFLFFFRWTTHRYSFRRHELDILYKPT